MIHEVLDEKARAALAMSIVMFFMEVMPSPSLLTQKRVRTTNLKASIVPFIPSFIQSVIASIFRRLSKSIILKCLNLIFWKCSQH